MKPLFALFVTLAAAPAFAHDGAHPHLHPFDMTMGAAIAAATVIALAVGLYTRR